MKSFPISQSGLFAKLWKQKYRHLMKMVHFKFISSNLTDITSDKNHMVRWMDKERQQWVIQVSIPLTPSAYLLIFEVS